jgi:hypothetical protein
MGANRMNVAIVVLLALNLVGVIYIAARVTDNSWSINAVWERVSHILAVMPGENKGLYKGKK